MIIEPYCSEEESIVVVQRLSKKFSRSLRRSLLYACIDIFYALVPFLRKDPKDSDPLDLRLGEFLVLDNINFRLKRGDSLALLGVNGSGKTTLLRLMYGIYPFDRGQISMKGRVGALLAAGVGFNQHMTGKENIYISGAILGLTKAEVDSDLEKIIEFADIAEFIDAPAGTYSSGMRVRLGFSVVVHANVDILIADEVLAVGDGAFREKCFTRIEQLKRQGVSIIFVSHALDQVQRVCEKSLYLDKGKVVAFGDTQEVLTKYQQDNPGV
jgi:lipopolysaccharide transport system ATP-binding protein